MRDDRERKMKEKALEEGTDACELGLSASYAFDKFSKRYKKAMDRCGVSEDGDADIKALYDSYTSHMEDAKTALDAYEKALSALYGDIKTLIDIRDEAKADTPAK